MSQDTNVQSWTDCWNASARTTESMTDESLAAVWNKRSDTFAREMDGEKRQKRMTEVLGLLKEAGFSPKGTKVLDIGCGPGTLALPLARAGAEVTALDISTGMLDRVRTAAEQENLKITTQECSWWTADIDALGLRKSFDLVLSSMTPGVRDVETFDRMMACSKGFCYYSNFISRDPDPVQQEVYSRILNEVPRGNAHGPGMLYPFMYLYAQGYRPLVQFTHPDGNHERNWEEAAEKTIDFLGSTRNFSDTTKIRIRDCYKAAAADGRYNPGSGTYIGMMVWTVNTR